MLLDRCGQGREENGSGEKYGRGRQESRRGLNVYKGPMCLLIARKMGYRYVALKGGKICTTVRASAN